MSSKERRNSSSPSNRWTIVTTSSILPALLLHKHVTASHDSKGNDTDALVQGDDIGNGLGAMSFNLTAPGLL